MIQHSFSLNFQWPTQEPFLFCAHHHDLYPVGTESLGPEKKYLQGRHLGHDFDVQEGFRMYHGEVVPGFPVHPHRGFETITIVRKGYIDHADSLGAAGRYGEGDVQWMTAGGGVQHSEMFPLVHQDRPNPVELFQIWLNLPQRKKMTAPHFKMLWSEQIPRLELDGGKVRIDVIAGAYQGVAALAPPPDSWAASPENEVQILLIKIAAGGEFHLPGTKALVSRTLYFFSGLALDLGGQRVGAKTGLQLDSEKDLVLRASEGDVELLLLQGRRIGEPTMQYGPFVMNSKAEIIQAIDDYQRTEFGGWPWPRPDMVHGEKIERFAKYPDGKIEKPKSKD